MSVFGADYAGVYDALYRAKDYAGETDLIERLLARHGAAGPRRILDLGCGTGSHAIRLAERGHAITGVDRAPVMLAQARAKAKDALAAAAVPHFREGDVRRLDLHETFDAALMMFTVLGYQYENTDLVAALETVRRHLESGGLFIFDIWNGPAVLAQRPQQRSVSARQGAYEIIRKTSARLDTQRQLCHVHFDVERKDAAGGSVTWEEEHLVRFFFPLELELALTAAKLRLLDLKRFPDGEAPPDEAAWNIIGVAQAF